MGGKQSVHIQTPPFNPAEWEYIVQQVEIPEEYGLYRTLSHRKTGEHINEYDFIWPNQEEYLYYLKSFNWRYRQPSVVNTRFIKLSNNDEICSHSYTAKVYVQAVKVRISEISDIPYPDNLYVLMQALEGFSKIFEHSKYFEIEENQICVDDNGNVKIWVNSDLSINFPNCQIENKMKGQEDMVDMIVEIVTSNTDPQTEPNITFKQYYDQKKGRGKRFEEAKVMVLNYARLQNAQIPDKFEAILNMDKEEPIDINSQTDHNKSYHRYGDTPSLHQFGRHGLDNNYDIAYAPQQQQQQQYQEQPRQVYSYPQGQNYGYGQTYQPTYQQQYIQQPIYSQHPPIYHQSYVSPPQSSPVYFIPTYPRVEYHPVNNINPVPNPFPQGVPLQFQAQNVLPPAQLDNNAQQNSRVNAPPEQEQSSSNIDNMRGTIITSLNEDTGNFKGDKNNSHESEQVNQRELTEKENRNTHLRNNSFGDQNHSISETDDLVARSLPIKAGYPSQNSQQLSSMGQNNRAIYSHINPKDQWVGNKDGFGLTNNPQLKLKESAHKTSKGKTEVNPIKYFYSMDEELQIDPVIAADMARYLN